MARIQRLVIDGLSFLAAPAIELNAWAVTQATGAGIAVSIMEGTANFESPSALSDNPYLEAGVAFSRTDLTFNNEGCGFAGCSSNPGFVGFSGNYMYGLGIGYFDMVATGGNVFHGLEFTIGTGFAINLQDVAWKAFSSSTLVGSGTLSLSPGTVIGFSDASGFALLRYTNVEAGGLFAPAFDSVHAQFTPAIPEPDNAALLVVDRRAIHADLLENDELHDAKYWGDVSTRQDNRLPPSPELVSQLHLAVDYR